MSQTRWPLTANGNTAAVGAVLLALAIIFGFLDKLPWSGKADKMEVAAIKADIQRELGEIKTDVRDIKNWLLSRPGGPLR